MLMKVDTTNPAVKEEFRAIMASPERLFDLVRFDMKEMAERVLSDLLKQELSHYLGRGRYERVPAISANHRNGSYEKKYTVKNVGELTLDIPRDRRGGFQSQLVKKYDRYEKAIEKDISLMFLSGLSTRGIGLLSKSLIGRSISPGEVSRINKELMSGIDAWRTRDLSAHRIRYVYLDGVFFKMRVGRKIERVPMLIVIGVTHDERRTFLAIQQGDKESASTWREVFRDLKTRGLDRESVELGVMDGLSGLMAVFREEFPSAKVQRCQVHVARNVICKVAHGKRSEVADRLRDIFYASNRSKAMERYHGFVKAYQGVAPSAVQALSQVIDETLSFFSFPSEHWLALRTTNAIERVNKEFKRRTKPMEIVAGENSAYRLLCFIALKMELGWRSNPVGKRPNLPALREFTQRN